RAASTSSVSARPAPAGAGREAPAGRDAFTAREWPGSHDAQGGRGTPAAREGASSEAGDQALEEGLSPRTVAARAADQAERRLAVRVLAQTRWNRKEAASQLKISYKALLNKLKKWDVEEPAVPRGERAGPEGERPRRGTGPEAVLSTG